MRHLKAVERSFFKDIFKRHNHVLLLLDYDGTLTPIVSRPHKARLDKKTRLVLKALAGKKRFTVGIISGRKLSEIRRLVGIKGIYYAGNHGLEITGPGVKFVHPLYNKFRGILRDLKASLLNGTRKIRGAIIEDKGVTLSLHYRLVKKEEFKKLKKVFNGICRPYSKSSQIKITHGKKVFEVRPFIEWDKGEALRTIEGFVKGAFKVLTIFIGDDITDEDAFSALKKKSGVSIFVGRKKKSKAKFFLKNTNEARGFLGRLERLG